MAATRTRPGPRYTPLHAEILRVLSLVRPLSAEELSHALGRSRPHIAAACALLADRGLLCGERDRSTSGYLATLYALTSRGEYVLATRPTPGRHAPRPHSWRTAS